MTCIPHPYAEFVRSIKVFKLVRPLSYDWNTYTVGHEFYLDAITSYFHMAPKGNRGDIKTFNAKNLEYYFEISPKRTWKEWLSGFFNRRVEPFTQDWIDGTEFWLIDDYDARGDGYKIGAGTKWHIHKIYQHYSYSDNINVMKSGDAILHVGDRQLRKLFTDKPFNMKKPK